MMNNNLDTNTITQKAVELLKGGNPVQAATFLQDICTGDYNEPTHWFLLGVSRGMSGDPAAAEVAFQRSLLIRPDDVQALTNLGKALTDQLKLHDAVEIYKRCLKINPGHAPAKLGLAQSLLQIDNPGEAERLCRELSSVMPTNVEVVCLLGNIYKQQGEHEKAIKQYQDALTYNPNSVTAHVNLGLALKSTGQLTQAIEHFQLALRLNPGTAAASYSLGMIYLSQGQFDLAEQFLRKAFDINPYDINVGSQLATVYRYNHQPDLAANIYRKILDINPAHQHARFYLDAIENTKNGTQPARVPGEVVLATYSNDKTTSQFDNSLNEKLEYIAPEVLDKAIRNAFKKTSNKIDILELGCGSGICGSRLADIASSLTGTDISETMIEETRKKGIYDELYSADLLDVLGKNQETHDLVIAMDVLCYFGDLLEIFKLCYQTLKDDGVFGFSVEKPDSDEPWEFHPYGHFVHSIEYIQNAAHEAGFLDIFTEELPLRRELGEQRIGYICLLRKNKRIV